MRVRWPGSTDAAAFTLLEVVVTLVLLGLILGVSAVALASLRVPASSVIARTLAVARDSAIQTGVAVVVTVPPADSGIGIAKRAEHVFFLPDGRAVGASLDMLTGRPREHE